MATKIRLESQVQGTLPEANAPLSLTKTPSVSTTEVASQGGLLINIDNAVGDVDKTSNGFVEDEKYGFWAQFGVGGVRGISFSSAVKRTGRLTLKIYSQVASYAMANMNANGTNITSNSRAMPIKPNTKYKLTGYVNATVNSGTPTVKFEVKTFTSTFTSGGNPSTTGVSATTNGWVALSDTFTTGASAVWMQISPIVTAGAAHDTIAYFDINDLRLEEITEPVTNSLTSKSPSLVGFTAVGSTDNVDQSLDTGAAYANTYTPATSIVESATTIQEFVPTKRSQTRIGVYVVNKGTGDFTLTLHDSGNVVQSSATITNANLVNSAWNYFNVPCKITEGNTYHFHVTSTVADGTIKCNTAGDLNTCSFQTNYYKPSTNFTARQNNDVVSISADSDGFLEGAKIDLENGTFSWDSGIGTSEYNTKPYNSAYFRTVNTWGLSTANRLISGSTNAELIYKMPSWVDGSVNFLSTDSGGSFVTISASSDGVTYTAIAPAAYDVSAKIPFGTAFLKITANGPNTKAEKLEIKGTFDTSSFKILYNFPTNQNLYATYVKTLATATTTATYRATKYGFPAIEFADGVYTYLKVDTTATGSTVAFSADGTSYTTVADGANIALTSTTSPIVYVRSNITANRLYVSSNDYNADSAKDGSLKCNIQYKTLTQGLIYEVQELQEKVNDLYTKPATEVQLYQKPLLTQVKEGLFEFFNNSLYFTNLAVRRSVQQAHGIITTPVTVANTTTETTVFSVTQGANYLRVGKMIIPRLLGKYSTNGNSDFFTVRVKYGGVTVLSVNSATAPSVTNRSLFIESYNTVRSIGATGTMQTFLQTVIDNVANNADASALASINSTVSQNLDITVQWNAASVNNTLTIDQGYCEAIDA